MLTQLTGLALVLSLFAGGAAAQSDRLSDGAVRIGVLTDMSGRFSDLGGRGSVEAARMAVEDHGGRVLGQPIEVIFADHQNKPDIGVNTAREWIDNRGVDMVADLMNSAVALATMNVVAEKGRVAIVNGAGTARITNDACNANTIHYAWDTYALSNGIASAVVKAGGDTWFFVTADYAGGHSQEKEAGEAVRNAGGRVVGRVTHPQDALDLSSFILQAQSSGAKVVALANGGGDTINSIKTAVAFGLLNQGQMLVPLAFFIPDVHALGLETAKDTTLVEGFYWDLNAETRAWSKRFFDRMQRMPTMVQAGVYSSTMHYLRAVDATGTDEALTVVAHMKRERVSDIFARDGRILANGRFVHDMYLMRVKRPSEQKHAWDYLEVKAVVAGADAFQPLEKSTCPLAARAR